MPTIEIVCVEQAQPLELPEFSFALRSENEPISHRGLFYEELKNLKGCIYHLGNPDQRGRGEGFYYASDLLNWRLDEYDRLKFLPQFVSEIQGLLANLLEASPVQTLIFSSDYQFGPNIVRRYKRPLTYEKFWQKHEAEELWLNARYFIIP